MGRQCVVSGVEKNVIYRAGIYGVAEKKKKSIEPKSLQNVNILKHFITLYIIGGRRF